MSKAYSGIPINEKRTWLVPRWLKEAFVAFALVSAVDIGASKGIQHFSGRLERARSSIEADELDRPAEALHLRRAVEGRSSFRRSRASSCW